MQKNTDPAQGSHVINAMVNSAKNKLADDGLLLIFWGWLVFAASIIQYITIVASIPYGNWVWPILMPCGGIVSLFYSYSKRQTRKTKTQVDTYLDYLWTAFIIALLIALFTMPVHGVKATYFCLMILYAMVTFISGGLLSFMPLVYGSICAFAFAIISVFLNDAEQLLCLAAALLGSYIVPGHLLQAKFRSQANAQTMANEY